MMTVSGEEKLVMGGVLFVLADTLAAHQLGGFKVGVGFSLRKCRMCLATKEQILTRVCQILVVLEIYKNLTWCGL